MLHGELVLSKKPLAYYPLDGSRTAYVSPDYGLLNYADTSNRAGTAYDSGGATTSGIYNPEATYSSTTEQNVAIAFKGQPLVKGLRAACNVKNITRYISIPNAGFFAKTGINRAMAIEFYHMFDSYDTRTSGVIMTLGSGYEMTLGVNQGTYYLTWRLGADNSESRTVSVYSGQINRPKQIVINWFGDSAVLIVNGNQSEKLDMSDSIINDTSSTIRLYGVGANSGEYRRFNMFNAFSIFPVNLKEDEIEELRAAAWQADGVYRAVSRYNGEYISCFGGNIEKNGQFTITSNDDWRKASLSEVSSITNDTVSYPQYRLPEYINPGTPTYSNRVVIPTTSTSYVDYTTGGDTVGAKAFGVRANNKGTSGYTAKQYIMTMQSGTKYLGIYAQSQNAYYEYTDDINAETSTGTIATSIDAYSSTGTFFAGIDKGTGEIVFGNVSSDNYASFYASLSKIAFSNLKYFFSGAHIRFGGDVRSETQSNPFSGNIYSILFGFSDASSELAFKYGMPSQNGYPYGFYVDGVARFDYDIPAEFLGDWDGASTDGGAINLYVETDSNYKSSAEIKYATSLGGSWTSTSGFSNGPSNIRTLKLAEPTDITGYIFRASLKYKLAGAPFVKHTINKLELTSYKSNGYQVAIKDGRSSRKLITNKYMMVPSDNVQAHQRGPYDGLRWTSGPSGVGNETYLEATDTSTGGFACAFWVDSSAGDFNLATSGDFPTTRLLNFSHSGGFALNLQAHSTDVFNGVSLVPVGTLAARVYLNGKLLTYTGSTPDRVGAIKTNCWNHIFVAFTTPPATGTTVSIGPAAGSLFTSFDAAICVNDIAIFQDETFPTTNATKDEMASILAAPYFSNSTGTLGGYIEIDESTDDLTIQTGDGLTMENNRQWTALS